MPVLDDPALIALAQEVKNELVQNANSATRVGTVIEELANNKINNDKRGVANGVAALDATGKVPSANLPSYVDDVVEYANIAAFPVMGETGKIYIALDTNFGYRWSGSVYVWVSSPAMAATESIAGIAGVIKLRAYGTARIKLSCEY